MENVWELRHKCFSYTAFLHSTVQPTLPNAHTHTQLQQRVAHYPPLPEKTFHSPSTSWDTNVHV